MIGDVFVHDTYITISPMVILSALATALVVFAALIVMILRKR